MGCYVLSGLDFSHQVRCRSSDAQIVDFGNFDQTFWVYYESSAKSQTGFFDHNIESSGDLAGWVADHDVFDLFDGFAGICPSFVNEVGVCGNRVHFYSHSLECCVLIRKVTQLSRANEGKICRVEAEYSPFSDYVFVGYFDELTVLVSLCLELRDSFVDLCHFNLLLAGYYLIDSTIPDFDTFVK